MFNRSRQFNIISGQKVNYFSQRSQSHAQEIRRFKQIPQQPITKISHLGYTRDRKQYQYSYVEPKSIKERTNDRPVTQLSDGIRFPSTMVNYVSTNYNIINHGAQNLTAKVVQKSMFNQKIPEVNRKNPLTELIHKGRLLAPNYHEDYAERQKKGEFIRKRGGMCEYVCDLQKNYGNNQYFRKFK